MSSKKTKKDDNNDLVLSSFSSNTDISIVSKSNEEIVFDITNIEPPVANALRRILLSEIPTMAIDKVIINQNTSIIPDEVLSHRLGLIPILADADDFEYKKDNEDYNEKNSLTFHLKVQCKKNEKGEVINHEVYSNQLVFVPKGDQATKFKGDKAIRPVHSDILVHKLGVGQEIDIECICLKGIGRTHMKWSPVCTAYYRLLSQITFKEDIKGDDAVELMNLCPMKVFDVKNDKLIVKKIRNCTTCRECTRNQKHQELVKLGKESGHYEFHVESVGIYKVETIFTKALKVLKDKCAMWNDLLIQQDN